MSDSNKNVAVIGVGTSGRSACHFLHKQGYCIWAVDDKKESCELDFVSFVRQEDVPITLLAFVVVSPGVSMSHPLILRAQAAGLECICDVELAFRQLVFSPVHMCGITATNGKTTTTLLCCHMLKNSGISAKAVGNIGLPLLDVLEETNSTFVAELSSFQLQTMKTPVLESACILNVSPNHLDHHADMQEYVDSKARIALCVKESGSLYVNARSFKMFSFSKHIASRQIHTFGFDTKCAVYSDGNLLYRFGKPEVALPVVLKNKSSFEVENFLAAYLLARDLGADPQACIQSYDSFKNPPHRIEFVREVQGRRFYDDSKATNVDSVLHALRSFSCPVVLLAGGVHKGSGYHEWKEACKNKVRAVVVFGQAAPIIVNDLDGVVQIERANTFHEAITQAYFLSKKGDAILLSPGCSSYDMFKNYEERGKKFQEIVKFILN